MIRTKCPYLNPLTLLSSDLPSAQPPNNLGNNTGERVARRTGRPAAAAVVGPETALFTEGPQCSPENALFAQGPPETAVFARRPYCFPRARQRPSPQQTAFVPRPAGIGTHLIRRLRRRCLKKVPPPPAYRSLAHGGQGRLVGRCAERTG